MRSHTATPRSWRTTTNLSTIDCASESAQLHVRASVEVVLFRITRCESTLSRANRKEPKIAQSPQQKIFENLSLSRGRVEDQVPY